MSEVADIRPVKFWTKYVPTEDGFREVDWVEFARRGEAKFQTTPMAIKHAEREIQIWPVLEPYYRAWKDGRKAELNGTALNAWMGLSEEQIEVLKSRDTHTLEDLASLSDALCAKIGLPGIQNLKAGAKRFLDGLAGNKIDHALSEKDAQIAALQAQMADLMALVGRDPAEEPVTRRPGRPRKDAEAEAA